MANNPSTIIISNMPAAPDVMGADMFFIQRGTTPGAYMKMTVTQIAAYISAGGGAAAWGSITGTLSAQTDLQNALNLKANTSALATVATTGAYSDLTGRPTIPTLTSQLTNDSGFITSSALSPYLTTATAASTYATQASLTSGLAAKYDASNPTGFITSSALSGYLLSATAASTYATIANLALKAPIASPTFTGTVSGITATMVGAPSGSGNSTGTNTGDQTITLTGEVTGSGTGSFAATVSNAAVIGKVLTGYVSGAGTISATDTILQAIQKLNGNIAGAAGAVSSVFTRTGAITAQTGDYTTAQVTESGSLYYTNARAIAAPLTGYVSGSGTVAAADTILQAIQKLNGNDNLKAPLASPTFTGTVTLPAGQVVNDVTLVTGGSSTAYLSADGTYTTPAGGGGGAFSGLTGGTNTAAAMVVGTGASLAASGSGTIAATSFTDSLAGEVTGTQGATVVGNAAVIGKVITGYVSGAGTVAATDTILQAIQKLNGNDATRAPLASPTFTGTVALPIVTAGVTTITAANASALTVGRLGATTPVLQVDSATANVVTGIKLTGAASGGGFNMTVIGGGTNEGLDINSKNAGNLALNSNGGAVQFKIGTVNRLTISDIQVALTPAARTSFANPYFLFTSTAGSGLTASTEAPQIYWNLSTVQTHATGTLALQQDFKITGGTRAFAAASTATISATFGIDGAPVAGTNATQTNACTFYSAGKAVGAGTTNSYGMWLRSNTGATNNYVAMLTGSAGDIFRVRTDGQLALLATNTAGGATGAQTINRPSGTVNFAAASSSLVVTNSLCTAASLVFCEIRTNDTTAIIKNVVPAAGSFTITLNAAATAETSVGFFIIN